MVENFINLVAKKPKIRAKSAKIPELQSNSLFG